MYKALSASILAIVASALATPARAVDIHANAALTSDYVFRGISQTQGDPAAQAGVRIDLAEGFYASSWTSTLKPLPDNGAEAELDLVGGWSGSLGHELTLDANLTRYTYPGAKRSTSDYDEGIGTLTWRNRLWLQAGWSGDVFASGHPALYTELGGRVPLGHGVSLEGAVGHYDLERALGRSYLHAYLALTRTRRAWTWRLALHDTDHAARMLFPRIAGRRVELSASVAF